MVSDDDIALLDFAMPAPHRERIPVQNAVRIDTTNNILAGGTGKAAAVRSENKQNARSASA